MKLIGNLKKQVEATTTKDEAREAIRSAGMELTDDELDQVAGGRTVSEPGKEFNLVSPFPDENHDENNKGGK